MLGEQIQKHSNFRIGTVASFDLLDNLPPQPAEGPAVPRALAQFFLISSMVSFRKPDNATIWVEIRVISPGRKIAFTSSS